MTPRIATVAMSGALLVGACAGTGAEFGKPDHDDLAPGGVYISYNLGCEQGCDLVEKGDLIQSIDGKPVATAEEFDAARIQDGAPHQLALLAKGTHAPKTVQIVAKPKNNLPPLTEVPPFWTASAEELDRAPTWARRRMYGHASPMVQLVSIDGGILDGRQLHGKKRLIVYWDWGDRIEQANAVTFMQVLQKAQSDLATHHVDIMFAHVSFPGTRKRPMNDSDLRAFADQWSVKDNGQKLPMIPFYRRPNKTEYNAARELGLENAYTVMENLGESPTIVILDERGIVRWQSEGITQPPADAADQKADQYTIISAVEFALQQL